MVRKVLTRNRTGPVLASVLALGLVAALSSRAEAAHSQAVENQAVVTPVQYGYWNYPGRVHSYRFGYGYPRHHHGHYDWHDTSHYDWHPGHFRRHRNHYHYVPGHYDFHRDGHWDYHGHH